MRHLTVDQAKPRWVLATTGDAPLPERAVAWRAERDQFGDDGDVLPALLNARGSAYELVQVTGDDAALFPLPGERPRYWESLHGEHDFLGDVSHHLEVYRSGADLLLVDDSGPGSPELLGSIPAHLGPEPGWPDDLGIATDDIRWEVMSQASLRWMREVESSALAKHLGSMRAEAGWHLVDQLRRAGFDPTKQPLTEWLATRIAQVAAGQVIDRLDDGFGHDIWIDVETGEWGLMSNLRAIQQTKLPLGLSNATVAEMRCAGLDFGIPVPIRRGGEAFRWNDPTS